MIEKISLEEFRKLREELKIAKDDQEYYKIQNKILSYDLSEIPFHEWLDFEVYSDTNQIANFSKTKANINFNFLRFNKYFAPGNFKGCNIKNLENRPWIINSVSFDNFIINSNSHLFLSNAFTEEFKQKYYSNKITMDDLLNLSSEQIKELDDKFIMLHLVATKEEKTLIKKFKLYKFLELYKYSKEDYYYVIKVLNIINNLNLFMYSLDKEIIIDSKEFINKTILNANISEMKEACNECFRTLIIQTNIININGDISEEIKEKNKDIFLIDVDISDKLKQKYFNKKLLLTDVFYYIEFFDKFPIENFIIENKLVKSMIDKFGYGSLVKFMKKYPEFFEYLLHDSIHYINEFANCISRSNEENDDKTFRQAVKEFCTNTYGSHNMFVPDWIKAMNFKLLHNIENINELMSYDDNTILINNEQKRIIKRFGIDNIRKLQESTSIFSGGPIPYETFDNFNTFAMYFNKYSIKYEIFKHDKMSYEEFEKEIAKYIDLLKSNDEFIEYHFIEGEFRERNPEIFIDRNAPKNLINIFYLNSITPEKLFNHEEYIPYLVDKNLNNLIKLNTKTIDNELFSEKFINRYGNKKFLELVVKYGKALNNITIDYLNIDSEEAVIEAIEKGIYKYIIEESSDYSYLENVKSFKEKHPEIFVDLDKLDSPLKDSIKHKFYTFSIYPIDIKEHPELIELLKDKNLKLCFQKANHYSIIYDDDKSTRDAYFLDLIDIVGNEGFLRLCEKYGNYLYKTFNELFYEIGVYRTFEHGLIVKCKEKNTSYEHIDKLLEEILAKGCINSDIKYTKEDAPEFLKEKHPELFLSEDAPKKLKDCFYNFGLEFHDLKNTKEWLSYLKGKSIKTALIKLYGSEKINYYFDKFGEDTAIKLGIRKPDTVESMLNSNEKVDTMKRWYNRTGNRFIPDYVVMDNIPLEEIDKFLSNGSKWSKLMKLEAFSTDYESREAMLKLAYSFGVFEGDERGFNRLYNLLTYVPKLLDRSGNYLFNTFDNAIENLLIKIGNNNNSLEEKIEMFMKVANYDTPLAKVLKDVIELKEKGKLDIDLSKPIFSQIYKEDDDGTRTLILNLQKYPKLLCDIRQIIVNEWSTSYKFLTPKKLHELFGGFKLEYNPEFREFLLNNLEKILYNYDYQTYVAAIQKQFKDIKIANSNRKLTLDLAISYVQQNRYDDVELGNESVAEVSAIAGYDQEDFDTLQKIYNYGKQRIFSSIPRIENKIDKYNYEMLRLDDPLAMAIGTLTDCCQEIGNAAEVCMEHSMVDKNGRVFVIKDKKGNIVSQSWVWRNGNVLCFDNIEIPNKAFERVDDRKKFTEEVYEIYKKASEELIKKDEEEYKKLFKEGKISEEEYEGLKLKKVTVGIGYNDIAETLKKNSNRDYSTLGPREFNPPVDLDRNLYTSDSITQYILKDDDKIKSFSGRAYTPHNDLYKIYDDSNFTKNELIRLGKLEINQSEYSDILDIDKEKNLVSEIADLYDLDKENTKVIMNANFAIIYEDDDKIKIADLFYNLKAGNMDIENVVAMQLRLAIEQIKSNKEIDISELDNNQKTMYNMSMNLNEEMDIEKGIIKNKNK